MPDIPQVQTCCFCCTTEMGSKIIGWWLLISGIIEIITSTIFLIGSIGSKKNGNTGEYIFQLLLSVIVVLMGVYLLFGVYRKNMRYLKIWLTGACIYLVILLIGIITIIFSGGPSILAQLINLLLVAYFIIVVYSFYKDNGNAPPTTY